MAFYNTHFTSQIETYLRICEFRTKLDKCPQSPRTIRYKEKLDEIIHVTELKPEAKDIPNQWSGPVEINGTYNIRSENGGLLIRPYFSEGEEEYLYARFGPQPDPKPFEDEEYWESLVPPDFDDDFEVGAP
jgi:hypothetical protein